MNEKTLTNMSKAEIARLIELGIIPTTTTKNINNE